MKHLETFDVLAEPTPIVRGRIVSKDENEIEV
jgi:hypothetical protein